MRTLFWVQTLFWLALAITLVCLLAPASAVLAAKVWAASWMPMAVALDAADATTYSDKLVHAILFATLGFLAARSWPQSGQRRWAFMGLLLLGGFTEVFQHLVPGRSASLSDWVTDAVGLGLGFALALAGQQNRRRLLSVPG